MRLKPIIITSMFLFIAMLPVTSVAQNYLPNSEMVDRALDNYPLYKQAQQNIITSRSQANYLRMGTHELTLDGAYTRREINGLGNFGEYEIGLSKGVRIRGKARLDKEIGLLGIDVAENIAEDARHQTALLLRDVWMSWLLAAEMLEIQKANENLHSKSLARIEKRLKLNNASKLELEMARSALETSLAELAIKQGDEQLARQTIIANFPEIILPSKAPKLPDPEMPSNMQKWQDMILSRSHEVTIAKKKAEQLSVQAKRSKLDKYADPVIGLRLFHEQGGDETGLGFSVAMPLGLKQRSALAAKANSEAKSAQYALAYTKREVELTAKQDVLEVLNTFQNWQASVQALNKSKVVIAKMRRSYELGASKYNELLQAEQNHLISKKQEAMARHAAHNAWLKLKIDAHELWLENIH